MRPQKQACNQPSVLCAATTLASAQTNRSKFDCSNMQTKLRKARVGNGHNSPGKKLKSPSAQHLQASSALCQVRFVLSAFSLLVLLARCRHLYPTLGAGLVAGLLLVCRLCPVTGPVGCSIFRSCSGAGGGALSVSF